jgi:hypothetical protein
LARIPLQLKQTASFRTAVGQRKAAQISAPSTPCRGYQES